MKTSLPVLIAGLYIVAASSVSPAAVSIDIDVAPPAAARRGRSRAACRLCLGAWLLGVARQCARLDSRPLDR